MLLKSKPSSLFLSHGGGPLPLLGDQGHREMVECLIEIAASINRPTAIIVISAHWEEDIPTITSGSTPSLIYDYYGFPEASYEIEYPCPGDPMLAGQISKQLESAGIKARLDEQRGFDHGLFVPLKIMYPDADIPCVQLSLLSNLDPRTHINLGQALQELTYDDTLVIGSGFSFHNLRAFFTPETSESKAMNEEFEGWLLNTCTSKKYTEQERTNRLINWEQAPSARFCHPREEHLLPLHVCYGLGRMPCSKSYELQVMDKKSSMYLWSN